MTKQLESTGIYVQRGGLLVSFRDPTLVVPRLRSVRLPWTMVSQCYAEIVNGCELVFAAQIRERIGEAQPWLPLETWE